jgi:hypothetical protein
MKRTYEILITPSEGHYYDPSDADNNTRYGLSKPDFFWYIQTLDAETYRPTSSVSRGWGRTQDEAEENAQAYIEQIRRRAEQSAEAARLRREQTKRIVVEI